MKYLPSGQIARPAANVSQALRFRQVGLLPSQFLGQQLLLCDVHRSAVIPLKHSILNDRKTNTTDEPYLAIRPNYSARNIARAALLVHRLYGLRQSRSVLGMNRRQKLLKSGSSVFWIKPEDLVNLVGPVDIQIVGPTDAQIFGRPASHMSQPLTFAQIEL